MRDLCESHAAYFKGIVLGINYELGSRLLFSRSPVDRTNEGDDQSTCRLIVIRASSIVCIDVSSRCTFSFQCTSECTSECSSETQSAVLCAIEVPKQVLESYQMLIGRVVIVLAENSDGLCDLGRSGCLCVYKASDHLLVYGRIAGFCVGHPLVKIHCHRHSNWPRLFHSELRQDRPNVAVLMDICRVMLPIAFDDHGEIDEDTAEIMHPEPLLHLILDLTNQALVSNDEQLIDI
jgi:hypothetical protein